MKTRAKVFEYPGECLYCSHAAASMLGWVCLRLHLFLSVKASKCGVYKEGSCKGIAEPKKEFILNGVN